MTDNRFPDVGAWAWSERAMSARDRRGAMPADHPISFTRDMADPGHSF